MARVGALRVVAALDEHVGRAEGEDGVGEGRHVVGAAHVTDVVSGEQCGLAQVRRHDLGEGQQGFAIGLDAAVLHEDVARRRDEDRIDHEVGEQSVPGQPSDPFDGGRRGEHPGLGGPHVEVTHYREHLGGDQFGIEVEDRRDADGVLGGDGRQCGRAVHAEGGEGSQVGLDSRAAPGIGPRDREDGNRLHGHNPS